MPYYRQTIILNGRKQKMMKKAIRIFLITTSIVVLFLFWMHGDVTLGRKVEAKYNQPKQYAPHYSDFQLYDDGKELYKQLFSDLKGAKQSIYTYFFIISDDKSSYAFLNILKERARAGVKVYVSVDWINDTSFKKKAEKELKESGAHFTYSRKPELPFFFYSVHHRNHRRITTVDDKVGYTGGFNIGNEYLGKGPFGYWRDYHVRVQGEGVHDLEEQFTLDWKRDTGETIKRNIQPVEKGNTLHTMVSYNGHHVTKKYIQLIKGAKQSIVIATPYFTPYDHGVMDALIAARKRGLSVKVIWSLKPDIPLIKEAAYPYIRKSLKHGIDVYGYKKGMFHGKAVLIDKKTTVIGTMNFTSRSFHLNDEMDFYITGGDIAKELETTMMKDIQDSKKMTASYFEKLSFWGRCKEKVASLFHYYL